MGGFEEAVASLSLGSLALECWSDYRVSLTVAGIRLVYAGPSRVRCKMTEAARVRYGLEGGRAPVSLLVLCLWGLEATRAELGYFGLCHSVGSTWHSGLFVQWLMLSHCLLALCAIGSALLIVHLIRHGGRLETSVLAASSASAVVLTVTVDRLFGLFLMTPFQLPIP